MVENEANVSQTIIDARMLDNEVETLMNQVEDIRQNLNTPDMVSPEKDSIDAQQMEKEISSAPSDKNCKNDINDRIQQLLRICDFMYETYHDQGEKILDLEQKNLELKNSNKILSHDHDEIEEIMEKYQKAVETVTAELREKEILTSNLQDKNLRLE